MDFETTRERRNRVSSAVLLTCALSLSTGAPAAERDPARSVTNPLGGGASAVLEPALPRPKSRRTRVIYTCAAPTGVEFSDRPCALSAAQRTLEFTTGAGAAPNTRPPATTASTRPRTAAVVDDSATDQHEIEAVRDRQCSTLEAQLDKVDSRMRQGYAAREAADLWNRWRDLKERLHAARC